MRIVTTVLVLLCISATWANAAEANDSRGSTNSKDSPAEVLRSLQDMRRRVLKSAPTSGRGVVELEGDIIEPGRPPGPIPKHSPGGESRGVPRHKVEFVFIGRESIRREFHPQNEDLVVESFLEQEASETRYWSGDLGPAPRTVSIRTPVRFAYSADIGWTYSELASVPGFQDKNGVEDLDIDWTILLSRGARVETKGDLVIMEHESTSKVTRTGPVLSSFWHYEFDRAHGGMLTRYIHRQETREAKERDSDIHEDYTTRWVERDGFPVPAECINEVKYFRNRRPTTTRRFHAVFREFTLAPVDAGELSMENMGIPEGTGVFEMHTGLGWSFGHEAETIQKDFPPPPPPSTKPVGPGKPTH